MAIQNFKIHLFNNHNNKTGRQALRFPAISSGLPSYCPALPEFFNTGKNMKTLIFFFLVIFAFQFNSTTYTQGTGYVREQGGGLLGDGIYNLCALFTDQIMLAVTESGKVYKSTNNGDTWFESTTVLIYHSINTPSALRTPLPGLGKPPKQKEDGTVNASTDSLWAVGNGGGIFFTSNSGNNWVQQISGITGQIDAVDFPDNHHGWAADLQGHIIHTTNAGTNWVLQSSLGISTFKIYFSDLLNGWVTGFGSVVKYTSNGGTSWVDRTPPGVDPLGYIWSIKFLNQNTGWMAGLNYNSYSLFRTTNGGVHWDSCAVSPRPSIIWGLSFVNAMTGYACAPSAIFKTTNGGVNWVSQTLPPNTPILYDIQFANADTGFAVGQNATILYTTSGGQPIGITPISTQIPKSFLLSQNYPNPFNPSTNISIAIPKTGFVKLFIYDALGREVVTLVNQQLNAGIYKVDWNASKQASGIYFYKLITGDHSETKKMVLVK